MSAVASSESSRFLFVCLASVFCAIGLHEDAAVEDALRFVVEDAVEILVAGAMRLGVLDDHVVIGELFAAREVKAVENALQALAGEVGVDVVARKLRAERDASGRSHCCARPKCAVERRDVKRLRGFRPETSDARPWRCRRRPVP